jgi:hypothetical protein
MPQGSTRTTAVLLLAFGASAAAQEQARPTPSADASRRPARTSPAQPLQKPSLDYFEGRWSFRWRGRESALTPGGVIDGTMVFKPYARSAFLEGVLEARGKFGPLGERALLGFDESTKALVLLERRGAAELLSLGDWTAAIAVHFEVAPIRIGGHELRLNRTLSVVSAHSFTLTEELSEDDGPFVRLGTALFSRPVEGAETPAKN